MLWGADAVYNEISAIRLGRIHEGAQQAKLQAGDSAQTEIATAAAADQEISLASMYARQGD